MRAWLVLLHRYVGLAIALFLVVAGLTGALLAFYDGLDVVVNAKFMHIVPPSADAKPLSPLVLRERVQQQFPNIWVNRVPLATAPNLAVNFYLRSPQDPEHQHTTSYLYDDAFVNPYTGEVLVARKWGDISQGWINLIPFIYRLHYSLALGDVG